MTQETYERAKELYLKMTELRGVLDCVNDAKVCDADYTFYEIGDKKLGLPPEFMSFILETIERVATNELKTVIREFSNL